MLLLRPLSVSVSSSSYTNCNSIIWQLVQCAVYFIAAVMVGPLHTGKVGGGILCIRSLCVAEYHQWLMTCSVLDRTIHMRLVIVH